MKNKIKNIGVIISIFSLIFIGCKDNIDPIIEQLDFSRVFTPVNLSVKVRNMTTAEISWDVKADANSYVLEFSKDSLVFGSIVQTVTVSPEQVPYSILLDGQTQYSVRVKGVSTSGLSDSKWAGVAFKTDAENIFSTLAGEDIKATSVTLSWPAGSDVTNFVITPGDINRPITDEEKAAGMATITGLTGETAYKVFLYRGASQRGVVEFTTLIDIGDATAVHPEDDLNAVIAAAAEGASLVLFPGDYEVYSGNISLNKSISIKGLYPYNKPIIHIQFVLEDGVQNVEVKDLEMNGAYLDTVTNSPSNLGYVFQYATTGKAYGTLSVSGCNIHDYDKSIFSGSSSVVSSIQSIAMDDCVVTNVMTNSADCIDFRGGYVAALSLTNSTFVNCAPARDFVRLDNSSSAFPGMVSNVLIDHCTLYGVANNSSRRILYVRFVDNTLKVTNTIIAATAGYYTNQSGSAQPECSMNNYFNAPGFIPGGTDVSGAKFDLSDNYTLLDPGFTDAANGNFTISNQTLIDNNVGDPRWH